jgi:hypothetical protein
MEIVKESLSEVKVWRGRERGMEREREITSLVAGGATNGSNGTASDSQPSRSHHKRPGGSLPESK